MSDTKLNKTVTVGGKDYTVPILYKKEGSYHVFKDLRYGVEIRNLDRQEAYKNLEINLIAAIDHFIKTRL
jgi:hypothetical protein